MSTCIEWAREAIRLELDAIRDLMERLDDRLEAAVDLIYNSRGRLIVTGMGKAGIVGRKIAATLSSTGTPSFFMHPSEAFHGDLGIVTASDVAMIVSNSGETEEVIRLIPSFRRLGVKIISLLGNADSTLSRYSDILLDVSVRREACPLGCAPTASTTAAMVMGDAVAVCLIHRRGFTEQDFGMFHPGGSLGKRLLYRVRDIMVSGEEVPRVHLDTRFNEAIMEVSRKRMGATTVVDEQGALHGVFTDGDLRRLLDGGRPPDLSEPMQRFMIRNPLRVIAETMAVDAAQIMKEKAITFLPVVDENSRVVGALHLHMLVREGLV